MKRWPRWLRRGRRCGPAAALLALSLACEAATVAPEDDWLIGTWRWTSECCTDPPYDPGPTELMLGFSGDGTLNVLSSGALALTTRYRLGGRKWHASLHVDEPFLYGFTAFAVARDSTDGFSLSIDPTCDDCPFHWGFERVL